MNTFSAPLGMIRMKQAIFRAGVCALLTLAFGLTADFFAPLEARAAEFDTPDIVDSPGFPYTFNNLNDYTYNDFSISGSSINCVFRFASLYSCTAAVVNQADRNRFLNGESVSAYSVFQNQFGISPVTLAPGNYSIVVRNNNNGSNRFIFQFDRVENLPGAAFYDYYFERASVVQKSTKYWQPFTIQQGFRYFINGINSGGLKTYILDSQNFALWRDGSPFQYFSSYASDYPDADQPEFFEIKLPPGDYYLAFGNDGTTDENVTFTCSRWRDNTASVRAPSPQPVGNPFTPVSSHPGFFTGEESLSNGVYYLQFPNGNNFGYYSYLADPHYIFSFDLEYEYLFDTNDGSNGIYLYDFASDSFFYTSPGFPFPYLYDFSLNTTLYYYQGSTNPRYFFDFAAGKVITK